MFESREIVILHHKELGDFSVVELSLGDAIRARGFRSELTGGHYGTMAVSVSVDERIAAQIADIISVLTFAIVKFPKGVTSVEELGTSNPGALLDLMKLYRGKFPDPFRKIGRDSAQGSKEEASG